MADEKLADVPSESSTKKKAKKYHKPTLGRQCAAWGCYNKGLKEGEGGERVPSELSFFTFPEDKDRLSLWCSRIKRVNGKDNFKVTKATTLCEKHFRTEDIHRPPGGTRKRLKDKKTVVPYLTEEEAFEASSSNPNKRKKPTLRPSPRKKYREVDPEIDASPT
ncbi:THAP domain-containing protein 1-like [Clytia hemisphaerica]|uniref:THAP domain-containing protein 1-like n=1 Tax=Clytia hemisphaerica TaxID=252671 RepID=UPI0034D58865